MATLIRATLDLRRRSLVWYSVGLALYGWFIVWYYPQFAGNEELFRQIQQVFSKELLAAFGGSDLDWATFGGFLGVEYLSLIWVIVVAAAMMGFAAATIAREVEDQTMDMTLTQPVSRTSVALARLVAMAVYAALIHAVAVGAIWLSARVYDIEVTTDAMLLLYAAGLLVMLAIGAFAFMVSALVSTGGRVAAVTSAVLGAMWLANFLSAVSESAEFLDVFTLFHYWQPSAIIDEATVNAEAWWALGIPAVLFAAIGTWRFATRDIRV